MINSVFIELPQLKRQLGNYQEQLKQAKGWSAELPVPLLNRCWLRLDCLKVGNLLQHLPVDASGHAPELIRFQQLLSKGNSADQAERLCWEEFSEEACHLALRRYWEAQQNPLYLWSLGNYLDFLEKYRKNIQTHCFSLPLLILPRGTEKQQLQCHWL